MLLNRLILTLIACLTSQSLIEAQQDPFADIGEDSNITVNFHNEDLGQVLELFSATYKLNLVYGPEIGGTVTMNFFDAPVEDALRQILAANDMALEIDGNFLVVRPKSNLDGEPQTVRYLPTVVRLNHIRASDAIKMLSPLLVGSEQIISGNETSKGVEGVTDLGGNEEANRETLVIYASEQTVVKVRTLLEELDVPPLQVLVEATIMSVTLNDDFQLGVDFSAFGGIDFQAMGGSTDITNGITTGAVTGAELDGWLGGLAQNGFTDSAADGLHFGILRNQVGMFVSALESAANATVLSNPQILTVNRHAAELLVGAKLPYITTTVTDTGSLQSVSFLEVGTSLVFRPFVSEDGYVRMEVFPKKSSGFINTDGLPEETTTEVKTNILVREGNTVVIGGLMESSLVSQTDQVPFLGSLPLIGELFQSQQESEVKTEIIVMLTPHIVNDSTLASRAASSKQRMQAAHAELAASHHGYLRPSYARKLYREAATALAAGDVQTALAKAEWGLSAMPADPDLAALAAHCRGEIFAARNEALELQDTINFLDQIKSQQ
ncbi:MAG: secretin N-terminal domain-containing protein [Planctomycetota bacterium]|jgi:type II secretory pathway component GspD/PulD (secretin)|nr:secretin N-terminal domain-containing protein [Planctomycetota bacterium]